MTTTGGSIGASLEGKPKITNVGFNQDSRDKQGITRNTVVGDVEITKTEGSPINRDLGKVNEITKDTHRSTNINVESQTIEYLTNPGKLKEDIGKAKEEINDIKWAIKESIHDRGDDNRNFFGQLSEVRLNKSLENITGERLIGKTVDTEIAGIFKDAYKDLGYDINIIFSDPKNSPQLLDEKGKPKTGTAYVRDEKGKKIKTIIINGEDPKNATKAGLIGTIVEEGSHVIGKVEGRQRKTGTDEKGLESTGRASNEYFSEKYKDDNPAISIQSDGKDYSNVDFGENVGDVAILYEAPDKNGKRKSDVNRESAISNYIETVRQSAGKYAFQYEGKLQEIENLFRNGKILPYKELTDKEQEEILRAFSEDNVDELGTEILKDGSKVIKIVKENKIDDDVDELIKFKTLAVRDIIKSNISISYQTPPKLNSGDKNLDKQWDRSFKAVNILTPQDAASSVEDLIDLVYYDFNQPLGEYIYGIDIDTKKVLTTQYVNKKPIENHELIAHPYDFVNITKKSYKLFNKEGAKIYDEDDVTYLSDQHIKVKDSSGKTKILLQPFWSDKNFNNEVNSILIEELTNRKYNGNSEYNKRFLYSPFLIDKVKIFDNMEELNNFFEKGEKKW